MVIFTYDHINNDGVNARKKKQSFMGIAIVLHSYLHGDSSTDRRRTSIITIISKHKHIYQNNTQKLFSKMIPYLIISSYVLKHDNIFISDQIKSNQIPSLNKDTAEGSL